MDSGLLVEGTSDEPVRTGRPSLPLDVGPSSHRFLGMKITGDTLFTVVTDLRAQVLAEHTRPLPGQDPADVVGAAADVARILRADHPDVVGVGIGIGGLVVDRRDVARAHFLGWNERVPLADLLHEATGLPTVVHNDVNALTAAEHWFGAGRGAQSLVVITIGVGVGCGIVVHDRLVEGAHGGGGSIGHRPLVTWAVCEDGHRGCAQGLVSSGAVSGAVAQALGRPVGYVEALQLAADGHPAARPRRRRRGGRARRARGRRRQPGRPRARDPHRRRHRPGGGRPSRPRRSCGGEPPQGPRPRSHRRAAVPVHRVGTRRRGRGGAGARARPHARGARNGAVTPV